MTHMIFHAYRIKWSMNNTVLFQTNIQVLKDTSLSAKTAKKEASRAGPILVRDHFATLADYAIA